MDLLVEVKNNMSLFDFVGLKQEIEEVLKKKLEAIEKIEGYIKRVNER